MVEKFLRRAGSPHVFPFTELLAARGDMLQCFRDGKLLNPDAEAHLLPQKPITTIIEEVDAMPSVAEGDEEEAAAPVADDAPKADPMVPKKGRGGLK